jgi:antitoxin (DNA-binding transcriptional repressor) of toxin-antitoxin stability system
VLVKHYCFTGVKANIASIRELRTDFRSVKRKLEAHGTVVITDRGEPAYLLSPLPQATIAPAPLPDYLSRLARRQPRPLSAEATRKFWEEERSAG